MRALSVLLAVTVTGGVGRIPSMAWRSHLSAGVAFGVSSVTVKTAVRAFGDSGVAGFAHAATLAAPVASNALSLRCFVTTVIRHAHCVGAVSSPLARMGRFRGR